MEKRKPHHDLEKFKSSNYRVTGTALRTAFQIGYLKEDIYRVVATMKREQFYKSMTAYHDHTSWQDVYHVPFSDYLLYIKFTAEQEISEFRLLSFKEK